MFQQVYACRCLGPWKDCIMHCRRYHNIHCLWNSRFVPCAFDYDAERGLLLHTPTFSARLGADGSEPFSLFFYSSLLLFFKDRDWRYSVLNPRLYSDDWRYFDRKGWCGWRAQYYATKKQKNGGVLHLQGALDALLWGWRRDGDEEQEK